MNSYHRHLSFPVNLVESSIVDFINTVVGDIDSATEIKNKGVGYLKLPVDKLPKKFIEWFETTFDNLCIGDCELFYTPAHAEHPMHSDGYQPFIDFVKINYVFGGDNSLMHWYTLPDNYVIEKENTVYNTTVTYIPTIAGNRVYSAKIGQPSLVNVGQPHSVDNSTNSNDRWCICLFPNYKKPGGRVLFNDAVNIFKDYIVGE